MTPEYPDVVVRLTGQDGNGFIIVSRTRMALKRAGVPPQRCEEFFNEALSGDYDHLLQTVMRWVTVE